MSDQVNVQKSGAASAPGGIAISGAVLGDIVMGAAVRNASLEQVRRIAPRRLEGRGKELGQLAAFCTEPDQGDYLWWRAPAWSGKSALLSWFVLHPPPGVQIVSFFITARYASQNDRVAFTDAVLEQLADLVGEPIPPYLTEATRDAHVLRLLRECAQACQDGGGRLILVVDGLDEDRGVDGPSGHSIAGLLPERPPAGCRIVVASRPHPPVPPDVSDDHPLRDARIVRILAISRHAIAAQRDMERELHRLLRSGSVEQDLLGLLVAAGGGLSASDLAELTDTPEYEIRWQLNTVAGRSFTIRRSRWRPGTMPDLYVLGHEELQATAATFLGPDRLTSYRRRIHQWADKYSDRRWPEDTPEYLLRGYHRMLHANGDISRMVVLATDRARHDRMLDVTGGDAAALAEIITVQNEHFAQADLDLKSIARLSVHRNALEVRNEKIPSALALVWVGLGHPIRAEAIANSISDPLDRAWAQISLAEAMARQGQSGRATVLADRAAASAARPIRPGLAWRQVEALLSVATAQARLGAGNKAVTLVDLAESTARAIKEPDYRAKGLVSVAGALDSFGEHERASAVAEDAESTVRAIVEPDERTTGLAGLAGAFAGVGASEWAVALADETERTASDVRIADSQEWALVQVAKVFAQTGEYDRAEVIASSIVGPYRRAHALSALALTGMGSRDRTIEFADRAETAARLVVDLHAQSWILHDVVRVLANSGEYEKAETVARSIDEMYRKVLGLTAVAGALVDAGRQEKARTLAVEAEKMARLIDHPTRHVIVLTAGAGALADAGEHDCAVILAERAARSARTITFPEWQPGALAAASRALAKAGSLEQAIVLVDEAAASIQAIAESRNRSYAWRAVAGALAEARQFDRAEIVAYSIEKLDDRAEALAEVAEMLARIGDQKRAEALADMATEAAHSEKDPVMRAQALANLTGIFARGISRDRADILAQTLAVPERRAQAQAAVAVAFSEAGDTQSASSIAESIGHPHFKAHALVAVVAAWSAAGELDRAAEIADSIDLPEHKAKSLNHLRAATHRVGDSARTETLADQVAANVEKVANPEVRASLLVELARSAVTISDRLRFLVQAFSIGDWTEPLDILAKTEPTIVLALSDEYLKLHG